MLLWKLFYDNQAVISNLNGSWVDAPRHGVVVCVVRDPTGAWGRFVYSGFAPYQFTRIPHDECRAAHKDTTNEFYVLYPDSREPYATWDLEPFRDRMKSLGVDDPVAAGWVKFGRQVPQLKWEAMMRRATTDPDFPVRSPRRRVTDFPK